MIRSTINKLKRNLQLYKCRKNNTISIKGNLYKVKFDIQGTGNSIELKSNCNLQNLTIYMRGNNHRLVIESGVNIVKGIVWFEDSEGVVIIGKNTTIEEVHIAVTEPTRKIIIGEDCMFSHGITIRTGDSHSIISTIDNKRINFAKDITIGNHVWVGADVAVLKGVSIGDNSIIGIKSIVTHDVPANSIVAGIPAKVLKNNVTWNRVRIYE